MSVRNETIHRLIVELSDAPDDFRNGVAINYP
jgi:hypothetical protein